MKTRFQSKLEGMKRRYYEVFGDLEAQCAFLKLMTLLLLSLLFLSLFGAFVLSRRPPFVIRVDEVGRASVVADLETNNAPSEPEIFNFSRHFIKRFREMNSYTLSRDMAESMNLMSERYQKVARRDLFESGFLAKFGETGLYTKIEFKEEEIERVTPEYVRVSVIGVRTILNYNDPEQRDSSLFKAELLLKKVQRTRAAPWGLLLEDYKELLLNKLER